MNVCRICYEPCCSTQICKNKYCECKGTVAHVHKRCVRKWVRLSGSTHCKLCDTPFRGMLAYSAMKKLEVGVDVHDLQMSPSRFTFAILTAVLIRVIYNNSYTSV